MKHVFYRWNAYLMGNTFISKYCSFRVKVFFKYFGRRTQHIPNVSSMFIFNPSLDVQLIFISLLRSWQNFFSPARNSKSGTALQACKWSKFTHALQKIIYRFGGAFCSSDIINSDYFFSRCRRYSLRRRYSRLKM